MLTRFASAKKARNARCGIIVNVTRSNRNGKAT
jgi:hypothetical protein